MAKKSKIAAQKKREEIVERYAERRKELKEKLRTSDSMDERMELARQLSSLPRDASPTRLRNRDSADGRPRGYLRKFGLSRVTARQMAHDGHLPGVSKSSW